MNFMFRTDIGYDPGRGYAAVVLYVYLKREKHIKAKSIRELCREISKAICDEENRKRRFPLEQDAPIIITPNGGLT